MDMEDLFRRARMRRISRRAGRFAVRFIERNLRDLQRERWLHRIGLQSYTPIRASIGGFFLFFTGVVAGSLAGLALAPTRGLELRGQVRSRAADFIHRFEKGFVQPGASA
jgi:hypothetical protein